MMVSHCVFDRNWCLQFTDRHYDLAIAYRKVGNIESEVFMPNSEQQHATCSSAKFINPHWQRVNFTEHLSRSTRQLTFMVFYFWKQYCMHQGNGVFFLPACIARENEQSVHKGNSSHTFFKKFMQSSSITLIPQILNLS